jgi:transcriptional regulator with XRE-family HTH domain
VRENQNDQNILKAYLYWARYLKLEDADRKILGSLDFENQNNDGNKLEICREGLWLTQIEMGKRLGVSRATYRHLEENEKKGKITLMKLRQAAEAMDCELIYFVRPKQKKIFSVLLWESIRAQALEIYRLRTKKDVISPTILARVAVQMTKKKKVRVARKWRRIFGSEKFV